MRRACLIIIILILATSLCSASSVPYTNDTARLTLQYYSVKPEKALQLFDEVVANYPTLDLEVLVDVIMNVVKVFDYTKEPLMESVSLLTRLVSYSKDDPAVLITRMSQLVASWTQLPIMPISVVYYIVYKTQYMPSFVTAELLRIAPIIESIHLMPEDITFYATLLLKKGISLWPLGLVMSYVIDDAKRNGFSTAEMLMDLSVVLNTIGQPGTGSNVPAVLATYGIPSSVSQQIINGFTWPLEYSLEIRKESSLWMGNPDYKTSYPFSLTLPKMR